MPASPDPPLDFPSGPWTGYWQRGRKKVPQDLELTFADGVVRGAGWDAEGEFVIKGSYDEASGEVRWTRKYADRASVRCRGFRDGRGIWGTCQGGVGVGGFHVWPLRP